MGLDLKLKLQPSGKYDFEIVRGNPVLTDDQTGPILRLLCQGPWIADHGEREGESLDKVTIETQTTASRIRGILEARLRKLVLLKRLDQVEVQRVEKITSGIWKFTVHVVKPGQSPQILQLALKV